MRMIDSGVSSFKIEGRLKDVNYVKNVTAFYRMKIDEILEKDKSFIRGSSGRTVIGFQPDCQKHSTWIYRLLHRKKKQRYAVSFTPNP